MKEQTHIRNMLNKPGQYGSRWYVIHSKPRREMTARDELQNQDFTVYFLLRVGFSLNIIFCLIFLTMIQYRKRFLTKILISCCLPPVCI